MLIIRPLTAPDRPEWEQLFAAYAAFYQMPQTEQMRAVIWGWLMDPLHGTKGFVAVLAGRVIGLAHMRPVPQTLTATMAGFLDDLFVDPAARGSGAARALIAAVAQDAKAQGWTDLSWLTADDNYRARGLYDQMATRAGWITYEMDLRP